MEDKLTRERLNAYLESAGYEDAKIIDDDRLLDAVIGLSQDGRVVYSYDKMLDCLIKDGMPEDSVADFISYDIERFLIYAGEKAPIIVHTLGI